MCSLVQGVRRGPARGRLFRSPRRAYPDPTTGTGCRGSSSKHDRTFASRCDEIQYGSRRVDASGSGSAIRSSRAPCGECSVRSHPSRPRENGPRPPFTTRLASKCVESRREQGPRRRNPSDAMQLMRCGMCARSFGRCVTEPGMRHCTGSAHMVVLNRLLFSSSPLFSRVEYAT